MNTAKNPVLQTLTPLWNELFVNELERKHILNVLRTHSYALPTYIEGLEILVKLKQEYMHVFNKHRLLYEYLSTTPCDPQKSTNILLAIAQFRYYTLAIISLTAEARSIIGLPVTLPSFKICPMDGGNWLTLIRSMYIFTLDRTASCLSAIEIPEQKTAEMAGQALANARNRLLNWIVDLLDPQNRSEGSIKLRRQMETLFPDGSFLPKMLFDPEMSFVGSSLFIDINFRMLLGIPYEDRPHPDDAIVKLRRYINAQRLNDAYYCGTSVRILSPEEAFNYALGEEQRVQSARSMVEQTALYKQAPVLLPIQRDSKRRETYSINRKAEKWP